MSLLCSVLLAWAVVHSFAAASYAFLSARQRRDDGYESFALLSAGLAAYCVSSALLTDARSLHEAAHAQQLLVVGIEVSMAAFVRFAFQLMDEPRSRWVARAAWWAAGSVLLDLSGLFFDPGAPGESALSLGISAPHPYEVGMLPLGVVATSGSVAIAGYACTKLLLRAKENADLRILAIGGWAALALFLHDGALHLLHFSSVYLFAHASIAGSLTMSYLLLRRYTRIDDELLERTSELHSSYSELGKVQEQLSQHEELAAIGELSAVIAHEVRNPLAILKNAVDGLRRESLTQEDRATLHGALDEEVHRLNRIVRDLLAYASPVELQATRVPLEPLVLHGIDLARQASSPTQTMEVEVDLFGVPDSLRGDRNLLEQAIINIVENAMHAMPHGGRLKVSYREVRLDERAAVSLSFADTGVGMASEVQSRAREAFFTTRTAGTGLGLAIVERVVSAHGGRVELGTNADGGTTVSLLLPVG